MANLRRYWPVLACLGCVSLLALAGCSTIGGAVGSVAAALWPPNWFTVPGGDANLPGDLKDPTGLVGTLGWLSTACIVGGLIAALAGAFTRAWPASWGILGMLFGGGLALARGLIREHPYWVYAAYAVAVVTICWPHIEAYWKLRTAAVTGQPVKGVTGIQAVKHLLRKGKPNELAQRATDRLSVSDLGVRGVQGGDQGVGPDAHHPAREWTDGDRPSP